MATTTHRREWRAVAVANLRAGALFVIVAAISGWLLATAVEPTPSLEYHRVLGTCRGLRRHGHRSDNDRQPDARWERMVAISIGSVHGRRAGRHRRPSRRRARVGRELFCSSSHQEERVKKKDEERVSDRRQFLQCMAWVGTGAVWTMAGGVLKGTPLEQSARGGTTHAAGAGGLRFVQISDSHIGFDKPANTDVTATLRAAIAKIKAASEPPSFVLHTGDLTHLSKPAEFDTLQQVLTELSLPVFYVPGEHDVLEDDGKSYLAAIRQGHAGRRLAQLRPGRRAFHRPRQRREPQGRRARHARRRAARVARNATSSV